MMTTSGLVQLVIASVAVFIASFAVGFLIRGQLMSGDNTSRGLLIFFAVVALAGGLMGAHPFLPQ